MRDSDKPAFPQHPGIQCDGPPTDWHGMTLRDYFAGQALTSTMLLVTGHESEPGEGMAQTFARRAYELADAMLEARKAKP